MARNSGTGNSGCLVAIIFFIFFFGNAFLFSGSLEDDLAGNPIAIIMVLAAVIADISILYWIIKSIAKCIEQNRQQKLKAKADAIKAEISKIINAYQYSNNSILGASFQKVNLKVREYHTEIMQRVNQYREETQGIRNALAELSKKNTEILACPDCYSDEQRLIFLRGETAKLEDIKGRFNGLAIEYEKHQIVLPDADEAAVVSLKNALKEIQNSNKIIEKDILLAELLESSNLPMELSCFKYRTSYVILTIKSLKFCLFPEFILVFESGAFLSAIYPCELKITVTPIEASATFSNNKYNSDIVDTDSKCIQVGVTSKTWLHTCKDGTPDLRYSYNSSTEYRVDRMIYGKAKFEIADFKATFSFSSYKALEALEKAARLYGDLDRNDLCNQEVVSVKKDERGKKRYVEPITQSPNLAIQEKRDSGAEHIKQTIAEFDVLFSKCLTPNDMIEKYVASADPQEILKPTKIEILRFYLQHYSKFKRNNWTKKCLQTLLSEQVNQMSSKVRINTVRSCDEKRNISQILALVSVLKAVAFLKTNKLECKETFAAFDITEDSEKGSSEYAPQKIDYKASSIKSSTDKEPYNRFKKMRAIEASRDVNYSIYGITISVSGMGDASQFVAHAKYMETFEDSYEGHEDFQCYYSTYMNMNDEQLRTYFTWRTKVRNGQVESIDLSYAFVYIYELLNLIGVASAEEGMRQLLAFWTRYRGYNHKIDNYVERWVKEFYVYYRLNCSYKSILEQFPDGIPQESSAQEEIYQHDYQNKDAYLNQLSSHKYLQSKFYESELGYTLIECVPLILAHVDAYLAEKGVSFPALLLGSVTTSDGWSPFSGAVVDVKDPTDSYSVKISAVEAYFFANGKWQSKHIERRYYSNLLGYIIKTTEAELRKLTGYKRKLKPNIGSITYDAIKDEKALKVINHPEFTNAINSVVKTYFSNSDIRPQIFKLATQNTEIPIKPVEIKVDLSKLEAIRSSATKIQDRLVIDDNEDKQIQADTEVKIEITDIASTSTKAEQSALGADVEQEGILSELQCSCISIITSGQNVNPRIAELAMSNDTLPGVMIEGINDLLFETFGDNVIDSAADIPYIYDDYLDDVKKLIEED